MIERMVLEPKFVKNMNELHGKIASWAVTATSTIIFLGVVVLAPLISAAPIHQKIIALLLTAITTLGLYKFIYMVIFLIFGKWRWLRKILLGDSFLEGTWVGHWIYEDKHVYTIEEISQNTGETTVSGRQIGEDMKTQADWSSESVYIDLRRKRLTYVYSCDVYRTNHKQNGIGVFKLVKSSNKLPPNILDGYAVDMIDGDKDPNTEHKVSDEIIGTEEALSKAREIFNA